MTTYTNINEHFEEASTTKMLMEPHSGAVAPEGEWIEDYNHMSAEEWGGEAFEDAGLVEVVKDENGNWVEA